MSVFSFAQSTDTIEGNLVIHQSEQIKSIVEKHIVVNETNKTIDGWRIQIFSVSGTNSKDKANRAKAEFLTEFPDSEVYIVYNSPSFKVRLGNFRTKLEALYYLQSIQEKYPYAFAVIDKIELP